MISADQPSVVPAPMALPFNGATSLKEIEDYLAAEEQAWKLRDSWAMLSTVIGNIFDSGCEDKKKRMKDAVDEFKTRIEAKALVAMSQLEQPETPMDKFLKALSDAVVLAKSKATEDERLATVQPALNSLAEAIRNELAPKPESQPVQMSSGIEELRAFLSQQLDGIRSEIATVKASSAQRQAVAPPQRATLQPMAYPQLSQAKPRSSLEEQVWRSVQ